MSDQDSLLSTPFSQSWLLPLEVPVCYAFQLDFRLSPFQRSTMLHGCYIVTGWDTSDHFQDFSVRDSSLAISSLRSFNFCPRDTKRSFNWWRVSITSINCAVTCSRSSGFNSSHSFIISSKSDDTSVSKHIDCRIAFNEATVSSSSVSGCSEWVP